ncbi:MAG: hypothetical protein ACT4PJ_04405 [Gemmatimonadaceae bacterium]
MRHLTFALAVAALAPTVAPAQRVPGRDLLQFPVATLDRPAALGTELADGLGNPASLTNLAGARLRVGAAALQTGEALAVQAQLLAAAHSLSERIVVGISAARWSVADISATLSSPEATGGDLSYSTAMVSLAAARRNNQHISVGFALRARTGNVAGTRHTAVAVDAGILADNLWRDARVGIASFLWRPAQTEDERTALHMAGDLRVWGTSAVREARLGVAADFTEPDERLEFVYTSARGGPFTARLGLARTVRWRAGPWRTRLGVGLHYDKYIAGVAREDGVEGLGPVYQFTINASYR